jgi:hypothetical protein
MLRLCSNDSSVLYRGATPRRRTRGPCGLSLRPPSCGSVAATGVSEVSRFSCMKFLGVPGVFDYAGLNRNSRYRSRTCGLPRMLTASASGLYIFGAQCPTPPILYLRFTASLAVAAQDSRPSGSLLLSCKALSSSTSCRFIPAHKYPHFTH